MRISIHSRSSCGLGRAHHAHVQAVAVSNRSGIPALPNILRSPYLRAAVGSRQLGLMRAVAVDARTKTGGMATPLVGTKSNIEELMRLVDLLPDNVKNPLQTHPDLENLIEVVMDLGRPPLARFPADEIRLSEDMISEKDLAQAMDQVGEFDGDNRAGINTTLHRISCIRNRQGKVVGLTCRVGRSIEGSAALIEDVVKEGKSILLLGRPGVGKTTAIREVSRMLADEMHMRTVIVDTSNEIGGDGDIPHPGIGDARRMQVSRPDIQHLVMIEAVENHMPQVIVIDEIGTEAECMAARTIAQRGVQLVATAHGNAVENVIKNPALADLIGGIQSVTLGDDTARKRGMQKSILERAHPPTFDVAVEMLERGRWRVHLDVGSTVDSILSGGNPDGIMREYDPATGLVRGLTFTGTVRKVGPDGIASQMESWITASGEEVLKPVSPAPQQPSTPSASKATRTSQAAITPGAGKLPLPTGPGGASFIMSAQMAREAAANQKPTSSLSSVSSLVGSLDVDKEPADQWMPSSSKQSKGFAASGGGAKSQRDNANDVAATAAAEGRPMRLFLVMDDDITDDQVYDIMCSLAGPDAAVLVDSLDDAEVAVASRTRLRNNPKLKDSVRKSGVPLYAVRGSAAAGLARDLCPLFGLDPIKARGSMAEAAAASLVTSYPKTAEVTSNSEKKSDVVANEAGDVAGDGDNVNRAGDGDIVKSPECEDDVRPKRSRVDSLTSADSHAELMDSLVREVHGPVDRELAGRLLSSFLSELKGSGEGGGCKASSLATVAWALGKTKNKRKFVDAERDSLERLAEACSGRWKEFSAKDLLRLATGFGTLRFAPYQEGWVSSLMEHCSNADVLGSYAAESREAMERFTDNLLTLEALSASSNSE